MAPLISTRPGTSDVSRRAFLRVCTAAAAEIGLGATAAARFAEAAAAGIKPSVIWLHFQECTGCTESLLRTTHPTADDLIFDLISLDYHETLFAAAGHEQLLRENTDAGAPDLMAADIRGEIEAGR